MGWEGQGGVRKLLKLSTWAFINADRHFNCNTEISEEGQDPKTQTITSHSACKERVSVPIKAGRGGRVETRSGPMTQRIVMW